MECSSCGALYNKSCGCSKGGLIDKFVRDPNKTPDSSQRPPITLCKCVKPGEGHRVMDVLYGRKNLKEGLVYNLSCKWNVPRLLNTSESFDDDFQRGKKKRIEEEQAAKDQYWKIPVCYDDDDERGKITLLRLIKYNERCWRIEYLCFNAKSDLLESLLHRDTSINDSQKIYSLLDEFAGELTLPHSIPSGIDDVNLDPEGDILFLESLFYDNSSLRPPEEFNSKNPTEYFSPSPIPVKDSDSLMEEIDIFLDGDDSIPPGIESDNFDSEDDDNSTSRPEFESFHVDYPDSGDSTIDVVEDIPVDIYDPGICIEVESTGILAPLSPVTDTLLTFSSENEDKVFNHGVLASKEKSPSPSSHRGFNASKLFHQKSPMLILGDNTPNLGDVPDCEAFHAQSFVLHSLELHILSFILGIQYPNLFD
ncbi:hypothetical protein Tco_0839500 [Tanacetum coccineum]|uniref:Uncharacterized protein n=1 Tax=Tanacetum coccineum TaxID=301880 RepID=A0ABQ5AUR2_9ASTR